MRTTTQQRNRDFLQACRRTVSQYQGCSVPLTARRLAVLTVFSKAPSYYVGYDSAYRAIMKYFANGVQGADSAGADTASVAQTRIRSMAGAVRDIARRHSLPATKALDYVISRPAPRFYMSVAEAMRLINKHFATSVVSRGSGGGASC